MVVTESSCYSVHEQRIIILGWLALALNCKPTSTMNSKFPMRYCAGASTTESIFEDEPSCRPFLWSFVSSSSGWRTTLKKEGGEKRSRPRLWAEPPAAAAAAARGHGLSERVGITRFLEGWWGREVGRWLHALHVYVCVLARVFTCNEHSGLMLRLRALDGGV